MKPTLIFVRHSEIGGRVFMHGSELPPDLLSQEQVNKLIDQGILAECPERRSLYRLFAPFSGCKEQESLTKTELSELALSR